MTNKLEGQELVEATAYSVMKWHRLYYGDKHWLGWANEAHEKVASVGWNPLEDWNACMMVVEKMLERGWRFTLERVFAKDPNWVARFYRLPDRTWLPKSSPKAQESILQAALQAVREGE